MPGSEWTCLYQGFQYFSSVPAVLHYLQAVLLLQFEKFS